MTARRQVIATSDKEEGRSEGDPETENQSRFVSPAPLISPTPHLRFLDLKPRIDVCDGCSECWLRCSEGVQANAEEWDNIQRYLREADTDTQDYLRAVTEQSKTVDLGDAVEVRMCRYFNREKKNCAIYPVRPLVCRLLGHVEWMPCPIDKVPAPVPTEDALSLMRFYAADERKTFAEWEE